jgi:hypothetical protein
MGLHVELLEHLDRRWEGVPMVETGTYQWLKEPFHIGIFRDGRPVCLVLVHDAPRIEDWRDEFCLQDVVLIAGHECVHRISVAAAPELLSPLNVSGYFAAFYAPDDLDAPEESFIALVAGCEYVIRIDSGGNVVWTSDRLGIDGVVLHRMADGRIEGQGEWDPPGGWERFVIDLVTGRTLVEPPSRRLFAGTPQS